jgi:hypothetical protein
MKNLLEESATDRSLDSEVLLNFQNDKNDQSNNNRLQLKKEANAAAWDNEPKTVTMGK